MKVKRKITGFTVAELLIVIIIIGILAVLTICAILGAQPDKNKTLFKKAYSVTEKTVSELVNDETLYPYNPNKLGFINDVRVQIPGEKEGELTEKDNADIKFAQLFIDKLNIIPDKDGKFPNPKDNPVKFRTADGIDWEIYQRGFDENGKTPVSDTSHWKLIRVDVNGAKKAPNTDDGEKDPKKDIFIMRVCFDGKMGLDTRAKKY